MDHAGLRVLSLSIPGGQVYWKVIGTRANKTQAPSNVCLILIEATPEVENPQISPTGKGFFTHPLVGEPLQRKV